MSVGGLSKVRLGRLREAMAGHVEGGQVPGIVTAVSRRGELHVDAIGNVAIGGAPIARDTIFRIASMTKPIVAAATMVLVEECRLRLGDPVDALLPEIADRRVLRVASGPLENTVPANRPITVRDLLTYGSGYGVLMEPPDSAPIQRAMAELELDQGMPNPLVPPEPDEWMRRLGTLPLLHQPGEQWMYHTGSDLLAVLIARACGQPLETFVRERIFAPLGMRDSGWSVPAADLGRLATCYTTNPETGALELFDDPASSQWGAPPAFPSGGGGLVSTIDDYLAFGTMLLDGGIHRGERILSRPSVEAMTTDQLSAHQKAVSGLIPGYFDNHGWGYGVAVVTRRHSVSSTVGRFGWDGGFGTSWRTDPREEMVIVLMTQASWTSPNPPAVCHDFWTSAYQAIDD